MALPVTISSTIVGQQNSYHGPFKSSESAFYTILMDSIVKSSVEAHKATDPTISFTEQDSVNRPAFGSTVLSINAYQDGDKLHIAGQGTNDNVMYGRFDMSGDTWDAIDGASDRDILIDGAPDGLADACDLVVRSDGDIVVVYQKVMDKVMGNPFERVGLSVSTSANRGETWSAVVTLKDLGVERDMTGPRIVLSASSGEAYDDYSFIVWADDLGATRNIRERALSGTDVLQTDRVMGSGSDNPYLFTHGISFDRAGTTKVRIGFVTTTNGLQVIEFDAATDPSSFTASEIWDGTSSAEDVRLVNSSIVACLGLDGSTQHMLAARADNSDLYSADDADSDTWTTPASTFVGTINHVSNRTYDRSGTKLAHIIDDAGTVKYDEDSIVGAPPSGAGAQIFQPLNQAASGGMQPAAVGSSVLAPPATAATGGMAPAAVASTVLAPPAQAAAGGEGIPGAGATLLAAFAQSAIGVERFDGAAASAFAAPAQSAVGAERFPGAAAQTLASPVTAATGGMAPAGLGASLLAPPVQSALGAERFAAGAASLLAALLQGAVGGMAPVGAAASVFAPPAQSGLGAVIFAGTAASAFAELLQAAAGTSVEAFIGTATSLLAAPVQAAVGGMAPAGAAASAFAAPAQAALGAETFAGPATSLLAALLQDAVGGMAPVGAAAIVFAPPAQAATGAVIFIGSAASLLVAPVTSAVAVLQPSGGATSLLAAPRQAATGSVAAGFTGAGANLLAPPVTSAVGGMAPSGAAASTFALLVQTGTGAQVLVGTAASLLAALNQLGAGAVVIAAAVPIEILAIRPLVASAVGFRPGALNAIRPITITVTGVRDV